jgi:hypothetical protein
MALGDTYVSATTLKARLGITDSNDDARITYALKAASRGIDKCCHRQFNDAGTTSARVYWPASIVDADVDDFSTTTGLIIATDPGFTQAYGQTWTSSQYELAPLNGIVDGETGWPYWQIHAIGAPWFPIPYGRIGNRATLRVTARWGWAAVPDAITEACQIISEEIFKLRDAPFGVAGFSDYGAVRVRQNPIAMAMIAPYVRDPVLVA